MGYQKSNACVRRAAADRRSKNQFAPPYLTEEGVVAVDRRDVRKTFAIYGGYTYRAWVTEEKCNSLPWQGWYEIHTADCKTLLFGPTRLIQQFFTSEDASAAATQKAKWAMLYGVDSGDGAKFQ